MRHDDVIHPSAKSHPEPQVGAASFGYGVPVFEAQIESLKAVVEQLGGEVATLRRERDMWRSKAEGAAMVRWWRRRAS